MVSPAAEIPTTMKAAVIDQFGGPDLITIRTLPVPNVDATEILIKIHAAGVGVWDADVREGSWRPFETIHFPLVLGTDGAGIVVAKGTRSRRFEIGDRVWACDYANEKGGFYAEYVAVRDDHAGLVPTALDLLEAGAGATTGLTAHQGIDQHLKVKESDAVLIFGGTGAVGTLAIQLAKRRGAYVITTASGRDGTEMVRRLGVDEVIDARASDAPQRLRELAPEGISAVLALAGGENLNRLLEMVRTSGRVAYPNGVEPEPKRRRDYRLIPYDAEIGPRQFTQLKHAAEEAKLQVPIAAVFSLEQAAKAHHRLREGHLLGRIALRIEK